MNTGSNTSINLEEVQLQYWFDASLVRITWASTLKMAGVRKNSLLSGCPTIRADPT